MALLFVLQKHIIASTVTLARECSENSIDLQLLNDIEYKIKTHNQDPWPTLLAKVFVHILKFSQF